MLEIQKVEGQVGMVYEVMDVRDMRYEDEMFQLVIDKSTIDALLCGAQPYIDTAKMLG